MNGQDEHEETERGAPQGPTDADIKRYGDDDYELQLDRRGAIPGLVWRLAAGVAFVALALSLLLNVLLPALSTGSRSEPDEPVRIPAVVTSVIDARTIRVEIEGEQQVVRYIGVRAPVTGDPYYEVAIAANEQWTASAEVFLEADETDSDIEGRLLRYVWLNGAMVNSYLLSVGLASLDETGQNDRYLGILQRAESNARSAGIGIWADPNRSVSIGDGVAPES